MTRQTFPQIIEDRIRRHERRGRRIRIDQADEVSFSPPAQTDPSNRPQALIWNVHYLTRALYVRTGVSTAITKNTLTLSTTDSGTGVFSVANLTWTDSAKSWTVDQWQDYYVKIDSQYYLILSNTATILTLDLSAGDLIAGGSYDIVPFIPKSLVGAWINPDTANNHRFRIMDNTETVITVLIYARHTGTVTTGDASAPYTVFRDDDFDDFSNDRFNGYSIHFLTGDNAGETRLISDFVGSTGEFTLASGTTNSIDIGDSFEAVRDLLFVDVSDTWRLERFYPISSSDFSAADPEDLQIKEIVSEGGDLKDSNLPPHFAGAYSVEFKSNVARSFNLGLLCNNSLRIDLTDLARSEISTLADSGFIRNGITQITISLRRNVWYRLDLYLYVDAGGFGLQMDSLTPYIYQWRDAVPGAPTWISISGITTGNAIDVKTQELNVIVLRWTQHWRLGLGGVTEIWVSDTESGGYSNLGFVKSGAMEFKHTITGSTTKWYKARHRSAKGDVGPFTVARRGKTHRLIIRDPITGKHELRALLEMQ